MRKIILTAFLFLAFCLPSLSVESIFVPDITKDQIKKALIGFYLKNNWQIKSDSDYTLDISLLMKPDGSLKNHFMWCANNQRDNYNIHLSGAIYPMVVSVEKEGRLHFTLFEKDNGVLLTYSATEVINPNTNNETATAIMYDYYLNLMMKNLFTTKYTYNIKYSVKKDHILITETPETVYADNVRLGSKRKIIKVNSKNVSEYKKSELKKLFNECTEEQIILETNENGLHTYYLKRVLPEPVYKQYL